MDIIKETSKLGYEEGKFLDYVISFYNYDTGVYKIATETEITDAVIKYLIETPEEEILFDSWDREQVRMRYLKR